MSYQLPVDQYMPTTPQALPTSMQPQSISSLPIANIQPQLSSSQMDGQYPSAVNDVKSNGYDQYQPYPNFNNNDNKTNKNNPYMTNYNYEEQISTKRMSYNNENYFVESKYLRFYFCLYYLFLYC